MAGFLPWITLLLGFLLGLLIYHIITIGKREDTTTLIKNLEDDLLTANTGLNTCTAEVTQLKSDHKEQVIALKLEIKTHAKELKGLVAEKEAHAADLDARTAELAACLAVAETLRAEIETLEAAAASAAESPTRTLSYDIGADDAAVDDLTQIKGIGPALAARLSAAGIRRYSDLAAAEPSDLPDLLDLQPWQKADPEAWVVEAERLAAQPPQVQVGDDLTLLEGIGPTYATQLRAAGIIGFEQLGAADAESIAVIIGAPAWRRLNYADWIAQAQLAAAGDEAGLAALQEKLNKRQGDNLVLIAGVGPQSVAALNEAGIMTYAALADATPEKLGSIFSDAGVRAGDFEAWIAEAKLRAAGKRVQRTRTRSPEIQGTQSRACPQDLARIYGIGTVYEQRLFDVGIGSFWEVGMLPEAVLAEILEAEAFQDVDLAAIKADAMRLAEKSDTVGHTWDGSEPDDFEILDEIGPVLERRLYAAGICTYEALAATEEALLAEICHLPAFQKPNYGRWIAQARERLAGGE